MADTKKAASDATAQLEKLGFTLTKVNGDFKGLSDTMLKNAGLTRQAVYEQRELSKQLLQFGKGTKNEALTIMLAKRATEEYSATMKKFAADTYQFGMGLGKIKVRVNPDKDEKGRYQKAEYEEIAPGKEKGKQIAGGLGLDLLEKAGMMTGAKKAQEVFGGMGIGMGKLGAAGFVADLAIRVLVGSIKGTQENMKFLSGTIGASKATYADAAEMFFNTRTQAAFLGVTTEEVGEAMGALGKSFVFNAAAIAQLGKGGAARVADSTATFVALAKGTGMTAEAAGALGSNLVLTGSSITNLTEGFAKFHSALGVTGLTTEYLTNILETLAPASLLSANAAEGLYGTLGAFSKTFQTTTDSLIQGANAAGKQVVFANAMKSWANVAAGLKLPELLAFGSKSAPGLNPWKATGEALKGGPEAALINMMGKIIGQAGGSKDDKKFAAMSTLVGKGVKENEAYVLTEGISELTDLRRKAAAGDVAAGQAAAAKNLELNAKLTQSIGDPMERLVAAVQSLMKYVIDFFRWFQGMFTGSLIGKVMSSVGKS